MRRDIRKLSEQGLITRHHGGAGRVSSVMNTALNSESCPLPRKEAIAEAVADYLPERCTVFITIEHNGGKPSHETLLNRRDLRIITNSLRVAQILYKNQDREVAVELRAFHGGIVGRGAVNFIMKDSGADI